MLKLQKAPMSLWYIIFTPPRNIINDFIDLKRNCPTWQKKCDLGNETQIVDQGFVDSSDSVTTNAAEVQILRERNFSSPKAQCKVLTGIFHHFPVLFISIIDYWGSSWGLCLHIAISCFQLLNTSWSRAILASQRPALPLLIQEAKIFWNSITFHSEIPPYLCGLQWTKSIGQYSWLLDESWLRCTEYGGEKTTFRKKGALWTCIHRSPSLSIVFILAVDLMHSRKWEVKGESSDFFTHRKRYLWALPSAYLSSTALSHATSPLFKINT